MKTTLLLMLFFAGNLAAQSAQEAQSEFEKTIRYEADTSATKPALKFWLDLEGSRRRAVSTHHVFQSGDRTKFYVESNADGFLYVAHQGSDGSRTLLFPSVDAGRDNRVKAHEKKIMPRKGFFTFDNQPGKELLVIILSKEKMPRLEALAAKRLKAQADAGKDSYKSFMAQELTAEEREDMDESLKELQSKTLVYDSGEASYQASSQAGFKKPLIVNFTLKHE